MVLLLLTFAPIWLTIIPIRPKKTPLLLGSLKITAKEGIQLEA